MTRTEAIRFYERYVGLMEDDEIRRETGFSVKQIRLFSITKQLCWSCANACNDFKCEWVNRCNRKRIHEGYPDYVKTKTVKRLMNGKRRDVSYIVECERYEWDGKS